MSIHQKVTVVTGASHGIGAGLIKEFLERNYLVVANSRAIGSGASRHVLKCIYAYVNNALSAKGERSANFDCFGSK